MYLQRAEQLPQTVRNTKIKRTEWIASNLCQIASIYRLNFETREKFGLSLCPKMIPNEMLLKSIY